MPARAQATDSLQKDTNGSVAAGAANRIEEQGAFNSTNESGPVISTDPFVVPETTHERQPSVPNALGCKCGAAPHLTDAARCAAGHTLPGAFMSTMHALKSAGDRLPPELAHLVAEVQEFAAASIADDGGESEVATRRRSLHQYRARVHRRALQLDDAIELRGLFDRRGKLRQAWLQQLQSLINTAKGIDSLLGLDRRTKPVDSIEGWAKRGAS